MFKVNSKWIMINRSILSISTSILLLSLAISIYINMLNMPKEWRGAIMPKLEVIAIDNERMNRELDRRIDMLEFRDKQIITRPEIMPSCYVGRK